MNTPTKTPSAKAAAPAADPQLTQYAHVDEKALAEVLDPTADAMEPIPMTRAGFKAHLASLREDALAYTNGIAVLGKKNCRVCHGRGRSSMTLPDGIVKVGDCVCASRFKAAAYHAEMARRSRNAASESRTLVNASSKMQEKLLTDLQEARSRVDRAQRRVDAEVLVVEEVAAARALAVKDAGTAVQAAAEAIEAQTARNAEALEEITADYEGRLRAELGVFKTAINGIRPARATSVEALLKRFDQITEHTALLAEAREQLEVAHAASLARTRRDGEVALQAAFDAHTTVVNVERDADKPFRHQLANAARKHEGARKRLVKAEGLVERVFKRAARMGISLDDAPSTATTAIAAIATT